MTQLFARILQGGLLNTQTVTLHWDAAPVDSGFDRNDAATYPAANMQTRTFPALVHYVSESTKLFGPSEFEVGDALVYCQPNEDLSGDNLWFEIAGVEYVQKEAGDALATEWTVTINRQIMHRTLLLTRRRG